MHNAITGNIPCVYFDPALLPVDLGDLRVPKLNQNIARNANPARSQTQVLHQTPAEIQVTVQAKVQENEMNQGREIAAESLESSKKSLPRVN